MFFWETSWLLLRRGPRSWRYPWSPSFSREPRSYREFTNPLLASKMSNIVVDRTMQGLNVVWIHMFWARQLFGTRQLCGIVWTTTKVTNPLEVPLNRVQAVRPGGGAWPLLGRIPFNLGGRVGKFVPAPGE